MVELIFMLGFMEPCISLSVEDIVYKPEKKLIDFEISQKLKQDPKKCNLNNLGDFRYYKWIVVDQNGNEIDRSSLQGIPSEVGLKNKFIINNQMLPKDFKPPLTFKVVK